MSTLRSFFALLLFLTSSTPTGVLFAQDPHEIVEVKFNLVTTGKPEERRQRRGLRLKKNKSTISKDHALLKDSAGKLFSVPRLHLIDKERSSLPSPLRFSVGDQVKLLVWGYPELTHIGTIQENGHIIFPLVGSILAENLTPKALKSSIEKCFKSYLKEGPTVIQRSDVLKFFVWGHPDLNHVGTVQSNGMITFPLVGEILAAGNCISDLRTEVKNKLEKTIKNANVSLLPQTLNVRTVANPRVSVLPYLLSKRNVAIFGEVDRPGLQTIHGRIRLLDALASAGTRDGAALNSIVVIRSYDTKEPFYQKLFIKDFINGKSPYENIYLQGGDIVMVPKTSIARINQFVTQFFTRTKPIFDWWIALQQGRYSEASGKLAEANLRIFQSAFGN